MNSKQDSSIIKTLPRKYTILNPNIQQEKIAVNVNQIKESLQQKLFPKNKNEIDRNSKQEIYRNSKLLKILKECETTGELFKDYEFPAHVDSITQKRSHKYYNSDFVSAEWLRPTELFKTSIENIKLFDCIDPIHIKQGCLGNCYFHAALSALAKFPYLVESVFLNSSANKYGVYSLIFYRQGIPTEIVIDDRIPCKDDQPLFAKQVGNQLWVMLLEKAWAKFFGNYSLIESGLSHEPMEVITGQPSVSFNNKDQEFKDINKF